MALLQTFIAAAMILSIGVTSALADQVGVVAMLDAAAMAMILGGIIALWAPGAFGTQTPAPIQQAAE